MKTFDLAVESGNLDLIEYLKPAALSLACRQCDVKCVKSLISKYNCDPKGLSLNFCLFVVCCCCCVYRLRGCVHAWVGVSVCIN